MTSPPKPRPRHPQLPTLAIPMEQQAKRMHDDARELEQRATHVRDHAPQLQGWSLDVQMRALHVRHRTRGERQ